MLLPRGMIVRNFKISLLSFNKVHIVEFRNNFSPSFLYRVRVIEVSFSKDDGSDDPIDK